MRTFSNIDFILKILPLKDDELVMPEMFKNVGGHRLRFGENMPGRSPKSENRASLAKKATVAKSRTILQLEL